MARRICVAGLGAVGGTVAARLATAGEQVSLIARGDRLEQLRRDGLRFDSGREPPITVHLPASDQPEFGIQDIVFTAVKAQSLPGLLPQLAPLIGPETMIVPLVNGVPWWYFQGVSGPFSDHAVAAVDPDGVLSSFSRAHSIIGCVVFLTARLLPSGVVSCMGGHRLRIGEITGDALPRTRALGALLSDAGMATVVSDTIRRDLWTKIALNLASNPLSVVSGATLVDLFTDLRLLPIVIAIIGDTRQVAEAYGITLTMSLDEMIAAGRKAGTFETSMLQDYRAGHALELGAIGYAVLELAAKLGLEMPTAKLIIDLAAHLGDPRKVR